MPCGASPEICGFQMKGTQPPASNVPSAAAEGWHACGLGSIFAESAVSGNCGVERVCLRHIFGAGSAVPVGGAAPGEDGHSTFGACGLVNHKILGGVGCLSFFLQEKTVVKIDRICYTAMEYWLQLSKAEVCGFPALALAEWYKAPVSQWEACV